MFKQYSPILASYFEQKEQENTTSYNLPYWPCFHGRNVRVNQIFIRNQNLKPPVKFTSFFDNLEMKMLKNKS